MQKNNDLFKARIVYGLKQILFVLGKFKIMLVGRAAEPVHIPGQICAFTAAARKNDYGGVVIVCVAVFYLFGIFTLRHLIYLPRPRGGAVALVVAYAPVGMA